MSTISIFEKVPKNMCDHSKMVIPNYGWDYESRDLAEMYENLVKREGYKYRPNTLLVFTFLLTELLKCPSITTRGVHPRKLGLHDAYAPLVHELVSFGSVPKMIANRWEEIPAQRLGERSQHIPQTYRVDRRDFQTSGHW